MSQTKKQSHIEIITNQVVGIVIGWSIVYFIFPLMSSLTQSQLATVSTIIFFISSYFRGYILRRFFNWRHRNGI